MGRLAAACVFLFFLPAAMHPQGAFHGSLEKGVYTNSTMGFRYNAPPGMVDITADARAQVQQRAAASHRASVFSILLALVSGPDDTSPDWHSMGIQAFPRTAFRGSDDLHAESLMNASVARGGLSIGPNQSVSFSNQHFVATQFEMHEGALTKHATVYTTVRDGDLLSFDFSGNSADQVAKMTDTMKSLSFSLSGAAH